MSSANFQHLVVLIGTNPLPNFVVADYFLKKNSALKTIWLVHSEDKPDIQQPGTKKFAEKLKFLIQQRHSNRTLAFEYVPLANVSRAKEIERSFTEKCLNKLEARSAVHVNYTGGTKVMSTHIYRAMERSQKFSHLSFSYMDPKSFKIIFDDETLPDSDDLRKEIEMTFAQIISLHGYVRINTDTQEISQQFADVIQVFANIIESGRVSEYLTEKKSQLKSSAMQAYAPHTAFASVLDKLPEGYRLQQDGKFANEYTPRFLDGLWLEEYVFSVLKKGLSRLPCSLVKNWKIRKTEWEGDSKFELDIIVIKGYQVIGISCTTSHVRSMCKSKGFEIIQRIRQISGDEAKAVVVTRLPESEKQEKEIINPRAIVEKELQLDTGSGENIIVLGAQDWEQTRLLQKIQDFIKE